jgi:hypothetical protein
LDLALILLEFKLKPSQLLKELVLLIIAVDYEPPIPVEVELRVADMNLEPSELPPH